MICFGLERLDLGLQGFVFGHLALEKPASEGGLFGNAGRREQVGVIELVLAVLKIFELNQALVHERLEAVVHLAVADAQLPRQVALRNVGALLQQFEHAKAQVFGLLVVDAGHFEGN